MKEKNGLAAILFGATILLGAGGALAGGGDRQGEHPGWHHAREACKGDAEKFCKDVQPGGGRKIRCLAEHKADLSEGCRQALEHARDQKGPPPAPPAPPAR